jgi:acetate kinase
VNVLALNSGSSSLKFGLYRMGADQAKPLLEGHLDTIDGLLDRMAAGKLPPPQAVGHRIVHGGPALRVHTVVDAAVLNQIDAAANFAPLHTPQSLAVMRRSRELFPGLPQVACFDTAFHATLPEVARVLPLPRTLLAQGIQRYGFHGLSCESIVTQLTRELPEGLPERVLIAHLGHGASVTAVKSGRSIDTSMGLTPSGGLIMGTRCGDIDPGVLIHLMQQLGGDPNRLSDMLVRQSGLLGISGLSSDMRQLHDAEAGDAQARLAVRMFCVAVGKQLAAMATVLGGLDLIVFSGGIGENDASVRADVCQTLAWFGVVLDAESNQSGQSDIGAASSCCDVRVVASQEELQIARHTASLLRKMPP